MDVIDVLRDRAQEPPGLSRTVAVAAVAHCAVAVLVLARPAGWTPHTRAPQPVMTITLGSGAPGPQTGGMTQLGGRSVQTVTPPENKRDVVTPPSPKAPEMTLPSNKPPLKASPAPVTQAPDSAAGRTPSSGAEVTPGTANVDTGIRGQGFGLSTSGGGGTGVRLDVVDFCCPDYIDLMSQRIRQNWDSRAETASEVVVFFTIQRDGTLSDVKVEKSSGSDQLDIRAQRSIVTTRQLPPLPAAFPNPTLPVHLTFLYLR